MKQSKLLWASAAAAGLLIGQAVAASKQKRGSRLSGKVALITGASRGLGLQLARELKNEKCKLILVARNEKELAAASAELRSEDTEVHTIACDLTQAAELTNMLQTAKAIYGRIDILINNAGRIDVGPLDSLSENDFHLALDLMFWAPLRIVLDLLASFLQSGNADIVNISSIGGKIAVPHLLPYSCAKFALCGLSEGLASELRHRGVHVLTVMPGLLRTGSHKQALFTGKQEEEYRWFALGATTPGVSMEVGRAARQIISALKARRPSLTLTWTAQVATRLHGAFPNSSQRLLSYVNQVLPDPVVQPTKVRGAQLDERQPTAFRALEVFGEAAVKAQHEAM